MGDDHKNEDLEQNEGKPPVNLGSKGQPSKRFKVAGVLLRVTTVLLSTLALTLMVTNKETVEEKSMFFSVELTAKYSYTVAFVYLIYANGAAALYCFLTGMALLFNLSEKGGKVTDWIIFLLDQGFTYILLSAGAASAEVAYIAKQGEQKATWNEVCSVFGRFCNIGGGSIIANFLAVVLLATLSVMSAHKLFQNQSPSRWYSRAPA